MDNKEIILDVAGVLATNFSPHFWQELSEESNTPYEMLFHLRKEMREELWTGRIPEEGFWDQLRMKFPAINIANDSSIKYQNRLPQIYSR
ncbi:hypothetical protein [Paenibacillus andongensis]|uniref:hypothetical protein n=1 Tax=Paenibacillus andongensis TaxID=2975482 RepID=UPI0021BA80F3|nr:hypothetical protein [Paenibacillus andongensis]